MAENAQLSLGPCGACHRRFVGSSNLRCRANDESSVVEYAKYHDLPSIFVSSTPSANCDLFSESAVDVESAMWPRLDRIR